MTLVGACADVATGCTPNQNFPLNIGTLNGNDGSPANAVLHVRVKATANASLRNGPFTKSDAPSASSSTTDPTPGNNSASENATVWTVPSTPTGPPQARPGNTNAFFLWQESDVSATNGGSAIDSFRPTVTGPSAPSLADVPVGDSCGTSGNQVTFCTGASPLTNSQTYTFVVTAHNAVGFSDPTTGVTATPSIDASAKQINNGGSQQTGNTANPTKTDPQISIQNFPSGTTGVGTILETSANSTSFCGTVAVPGPCVGKIVRTKLLDPNLAGAYTITLLYDKTLVGGTGQKYSFFYAASDTAPNGQVLDSCPKTIKSGNLPCVEVKLGSGGANPALKAIIHTTDDDPTIGGRAYPK